MGTITIGRYAHPSVTADYSGWIEPADRSWIIYLDERGTPDIYFPSRDEDGGVVGAGVQL